MNADDLARDLARAFPDAPGELRRLHDRLAASAERDGILDVAYRTVDNPVGPLLLAATEACVVRVAYASEGHDTVLQALADRISPRILDTRLDAPARTRRVLCRATAQLRLAAGLAAFGRIPARRAEPPARARVRAHRQLRRSCQSPPPHPKAVRAAATACATNPLPVVVPCHRVIYSDGRIGRYLGGPDAKRTLLALEAAA